MTSKSDLVTFSHLRWDFVYQRPQHIISRFTDLYRVFYIEEPLLDDDEDGYTIQQSPSDVWIVTPHLYRGKDGSINQRMEHIIDLLFKSEEIRTYTTWYYTPMALEFTRHLKPELIVYDCMDELSAFKDAPKELIELESELMEKASLVFTGGQSLFNAKKHLHQHIHCFPSSIDKSHFFKARQMQEDMPDQFDIPYPRFGFFGVIDERLDLELIRELAAKKPEWQLILIGPIVKIDPELLPRAKNIHYLGMKKYEDLPAYISSWDVALMPFALNEHTRFISPTKTPEYLAAGKPVISTAIEDVVNSYGEMQIVHIARNTDDFIKYGELELLLNNTARAEMADKLLGTMSWDLTWFGMKTLLAEVTNNILLSKS